MRNKCMRIPLVVFMLLVGTPVIPASLHKAQSKTEYFVEISAPDKSGLQRGKGMNVEGKAILRGGDHLWVFCRREDFEGVWVPQGEGKIDPDTKQWKVAVNFGEAQDVGWNFDIAVITVKDEEHIKLARYRIDAMRTSKWMPIEMPETTMPPQFRKVKKVSHD